MGKYTKFITAVIGAVLAGVATFTSFDVTWTAGQVTAVVVPFLSAFGVFKLANSE